jgi:hypothetical protein
MASKRAFSSASFCNRTSSFHLRTAAAFSSANCRQKSPLSTITITDTDTNTNTRHKYIQDSKTQ